MSRGGIGSQITVFALPLMAANIFQQLYGVVNSVIAGRCLGKEALAAAGTAIPLMNLFLFLLFGMTLGASVLIAEFFGAGNEKKMREEWCTAALSG